MATIVGTLIFEMAANVARLQSDMAKANTVVTGTMNDIKGAARFATTALAAVGATLSVASFAEMIKGSAEAMEHIRDLGLATGNSAEQIAALRPAVNAAGGSLDQAAKGMGILAKNMMVAADTGKGPAAAAFKELGISVTDADGKLRSSADVLQDVAVALAEDDDKTRAAALAKVLLGKGGQDLMPVLEEMARLGKQSAKGFNENAEQAHQFLANLRQLEAQSGAVKREFTIGMLPALNSIAAAFVDTSGKSDGAREAGAVFGEAIRLVGQVIYGAWSALDIFGKTLGMVGAAMVQLGTGHPATALRVIKEGMQEIGASAEKAGERITKMGEAADKLPAIKGKGGKRSTPVATSGGEDLGDDNYAGEFAGGGSIGAGMWGVVGESGPEIVSGGSGGVTVTPMRGGFGGIVTAAKSINSALRETKVLGSDVADIFERAGVRGVKSFRDLNGVMRNVAVELIKMGKTPVMKYLASQASSLFSADDAGGGSGATGDYFEDIAGDFYAGSFAGGGTIPAGMWGIAGEAGPEIISGGTSGASVTPMGGGGWSGDFYVTINAQGADPAALNRAMAKIDQLRASVGSMAMVAMQKAFNQRGYATPFG